MNQLLKDTLKSAIIGIAIGVALSFILPGFGNMINMPGAVGDMSSPLWMSGFMGIFNGVATLITGAFDNVFSTKPAETNDTQKNAQKTQQATLAIEPTREVAHEGHGTHVARLLKSRNTQISQLSLA